MFDTNGSGGFVWRQPISDWSLEGDDFGSHEQRVQLYVDVPGGISTVFGVVNNQGDPDPNTPGSNEALAIRAILGYPRSIVDFTKNRGDAGRITLSRVLPANHPKYPWLYANHIHVTRYQASGKQIIAPSGPYATYSYSRLLVDFVPLDYDVRSDAQVATSPNANGVAVPQEFNRFVQWPGNIDGVEQLVLAGGTFKLVPGQGIAVNAATPFPQGSILKIPTRKVYAYWHQIPQYGLIDRYGTLNSNIRSLIGRVNNTFWPDPITGYPPGTLLFLGANPRRFHAPVSPVYMTNFPTLDGDIGNNALLSNDPRNPPCPRVYVVEFSFLMRDPPVPLDQAPGDGGADGVPPGARPRGHNIFPYLRTGAASDYRNSFYLYTSDGKITGQTLLPFGDFNRIFQLTDAQG
jgi:hypothetical protein